MKIDETLEPKAPPFLGGIALFVLFGLLLISSLQLEKKWDAVACAAVCVVGLAGFFFALRQNPAERRAKLNVFALAAALGGVAGIAIGLIHGHWH